MSRVVLLKNKDGVVTKRVVHNTKQYIKRDKHGNIVVMPKKVVV